MFRSPVLLLFMTHTLTETLLHCQMQVLMFGGIFSALIVGFILENGDIYAGLAAESYIQSADDEEFWKGLSEEEKKKGQDVLEKIKSAKEGGVKPALGAETHQVKAESSIKAEARKTPKPISKPTDMFSDYGD
jgi:hypothetical protein